MISSLSVLPATFVYYPSVIIRAASQELPLAALIYSSPFHPLASLGRLWGGWLCQEGLAGNLYSQMIKISKQEDEPA